MRSRGKVLGLVLAGGQSRRMGEAKSHVLLGGRPLIAHVLGRLGPQCTEMIVSDHEGATASLHHYPIVADMSPKRLGPLAGIEAGLKALAVGSGDIEWLASVCVDSPFLPLDLVERLHLACIADGKTCAIAASGGKAHPAIGLWHESLSADLGLCLHRNDMRRVLAFAERHGAPHVEWGAAAGDPFFNINTPQDLAAAEKRLASKAQGS